MPNQSNTSRLTVPQMILPLPGGLDDVPFFNSNSPEIVLQSGILLSTFPPDGKAHPEAHLNHPLSGRFDVFFHHIANALKAEGKTTLYLALIAGNASQDKVTLRLLNAVSYTTKPDAPFVALEPVMTNDNGEIFAGPGDRVMLDLLRDEKQPGWSDNITLEPGETAILANLPIPTQSLLRPLNGRTGVLKLHSDGPVYLASLSAFAEAKWFGRERVPELNKWQEVLNTQPLVQPRDLAPTPPKASGQLIYGRVAGVASGSRWSGLLTHLQHDRLCMRPDQIISFPISTVIGGTLGTDQVQSAPLLVRYPDTAYQAHGNYGVSYDLRLPLYNDSDSDLLIGLTFQSPLKDWNNPQSLQFYEQPPDATVFRGTVKFEWQDANQEQQMRLIHLVQKRGQKEDSLLELLLSPHQLQEVKFSLFYPADCTPPHVVTIAAKLAPTAAS